MTLEDQIEDRIMQNPRLFAMFQKIREYGPEEEAA